MLNQTEFNSGAYGTTLKLVLFLKVYNSINNQFKAFQLSETINQHLSNTQSSFKSFSYNSLGITTLKQN